MDNRSGPSACARAAVDPEAGARRRLSGAGQRGLQPPEDLVRQVAGPALDVFHVHETGVDPVHQVEWQQVPGFLVDTGPLSL